MRLLTSTMRWACLAACRSEPQMPQASVLTSTWPDARHRLGHRVDDDVAVAKDRGLHGRSSLKHDRLKWRYHPLPANFPLNK